MGENEILLWTHFKTLFRKQLRPPLDIKKTVAPKTYLPNSDILIITGAGCGSHSLEEVTDIRCQFRRFAGQFGNCVTL